MMVENTSLFRHVILITGGSEGIGYALANEFARNGHDLFLIARNNDKLLACKANIEEKHNVHVIILSCDLAMPDAVQKIKDNLKKEACYVEGLINNVALGISGDFAEHDPAAINKIIDLNIRTATNLIHHFLPKMIHNNHGMILNVASVAGLLGLPYHAVYSASKAYLITLSQALAYEVSATDITVSVLVPGPVDTEFHKKMGVTESFYLKLMPMSPASVIARVAYNGVLTKQKFIVPGLLNIINVLGLKFLPHFIIQSIFASVWRSGSQDQNKKSRLKKFLGS